MLTQKVDLIGSICCDRVSRWEPDSTLNYDSLVIASPCSDQYLPISVGEKGALTVQGESVHERLNFSHSHTSRGTVDQALHSNHSQGKEKISRRAIQVTR